MVLLINRFAAINISSAIGEERLHLRITQLKEGAVPKKSARRLGRETRDLFVILFAQTIVDLDEVFDGISLVFDVWGMARDFRNHFLYKAVVQRNVTAAKLLWEDFAPELRC